MKKISAFMALALNFSIFAADVFTGPLGYGPDWKVIVNINEQKTYVYQNDILVREMICSTGLFDGKNKTPHGKYTLNENGQKRGHAFFSKKYGYGAKWWVGFIGGAYLFHSVVTDTNGNVIPEEAEKLGQSVGNGNIRFSMEDAQWFYETVPDGAKIQIKKK